MHHSDSDADSKLYYQKVACERDFMFFVISVGDFGTLIKIYIQIFDTFILFEITNHTVLQIIFPCDFWCRNFLLFWHEDIFMVLMILFVWYIQFMSTIFCVIKKYLVKMTQCLSCFLFDCITWNHQSHGKCFHSCNLWLIFWNVFWYLRGFWLYVF